MLLLSQHSRTRVPAKAHNLPLSLVARLCSGPVVSAQAPPIITLLFAGRICGTNEQLTGQPCRWDVQPSAGVRPQGPSPCQVACGCSFPTARRMRAAH